MRLAPPSLEIGDRDGFKSKDRFGSRDLGKDFPTLVESLEGPSVIARVWGMGIRSNYRRQPVSVSMRRHGGAD